MKLMINVSEETRSHATADDGQVTSVQNKEASEKHRSVETRAQERHKMRTS